MSKAKIKRGLSDQDMVGKWQEKVSFEHCIEETVEKMPPATNKKESFLTPELQEKISKALLEIKLALFKQGIIDYEIKLSSSGNSITLTAVPRTTKPK